MRIGLDGFNLAMPHGTGVATYGIELAEVLRGAGCGIDGIFGLPVPVDTALRETVFFGALKRPTDPGRRSNRYQRAWQFARAFRRPRLREVPLSANVEKGAFGDEMPVFDRLFSTADLFANAFVSFKATGRFVNIRLPDPPDVMHWTYPMPIAVEGIPNVYTLHDLVPLKLPYTTLDNKELYGRVAARCVRSAAQICTVSESSRRDIVERFAIGPERVTNTYQVAASSTVEHDDPAQDAHTIEGVFGLERRSYFLYFGAIEPKKNIGRLIEAHLSLQTATPLVIVGARAWQSERELHLMPGDGASGAPGRYVGHRGQMIVRLDYLPRALLAKLIRGAKAVVFPSLYEGFGLPVLEAMQRGTPVITSTTSSMPEVAGDAALLVNPYDVAALQVAMRRLDEDAELCAGMSARGLEQAKLFSREHYRDRLIGLYQTALTRR